MSAAEERDVMDVVQGAMFGFPETVEQAYEMYKNCDRLAKRLDDRSKKLREFLRANIEVPEGESEAEVDGVRRKVWQAPSTSYGKALATIKEQLLPKTRHAEADKIIEWYTKRSMRDKFWKEESEEDYRV